MARKPNIILTEIDLERLERLLEKVPASQFPSKKGLEEELERAKVVPSAKVPADVVTMNSSVRFREMPEGAEFTLTLVYPKDAGKEGTISIFAPVGAALLGLKVGAEIEWPNAKGEKLRVRIEEVVFQPERAGEMHL